MYGIMTKISSLACENSRPSSLPARAGSEEGRLFSQAIAKPATNAFFVHTSSCNFTDDVWTKKNSLHLVIN